MKAQNGQPAIDWAATDDPCAGIMLVFAFIEGQDHGINSLSTKQRKPRFIPEFPIVVLGF